MVAKPIDEYNELIRKYYGLIELTDSELNEAIEQLSSIIDNLESVMDYIRAQKELTAGLKITVIFTILIVINQKVTYSEMKLVVLLK